MTDELTQRELAYRLRIAIDRAMRDPQPRWLSAVEKLLVANPRGISSAHVTHNLGEARRAWLRAHARVDATPNATRSAE